MKYLFTIAFLFCLLAGYSQNTFNIRPSFNEISAELLTSIIVTDSCYYTMGISSDTVSPYLSSILFAKFDLEGELINYKILSSSERTYETWFNNLIPGNNGSFVNVGYSFSLIDEPMKTFFVKIDANGDTLQLKDYINPLIPSEQYISPMDFAQTPDGGYIINCSAGAPNIISNGVIYQNIDALLIKIDSVGNILWQNTYGDDAWDIAMSLLVTEDGSIIIGGAKANPNLVLENYLWQTHIIGLDSLGNEEWSYLSPPEVQRDGAREMVLLEDGSLIVASGIGYEQERASVNDMWFEKSVFKLNPDHELEWEKEFKDNYFSSRTQTNNLIKVSDGSGFILTGTETYNPNVSWILQSQGWLMKFDEQGDTLWSRRYLYPISQKTEHTFYDIKETSDGGFILCGQSIDREDDVEIPQQSWLLKLDEHGCLIPGCYTATEEVENGQLPFKVSIYPNPTTDYLNIYQYFSEAEVWKNGQYRIVDSQGRVMEQFAVGQNDVTMVVPVWEWAKGVYFLQLVVENQVITTEKFIIN